MAQPSVCRSLAASIRNVHEILPRQDTFEHKRTVGIRHIRFAIAQYALQRHHYRPRLGMALKDDRSRDVLFRDRTDFEAHVVDIGAAYLQSHSAD
jgi:hypothetical protein